MARELIIYADESASEGEFYSHFYGGGLVDSKHLAEVSRRLEDAKSAVGFIHEVKWQRVSSQYLDRYLAFADVIFDLVAEGQMKLRIMFTQNRHVALGLGPYHREHGYHILYYEFIKHAFGLSYANDGPDRVARLPVRLYVDALPDSRAKNAAFKGYISALSGNTYMRRAGVVFPADQIAEVDSSEHVILQAVDLVLGAMQFRLNQVHLVKPAGAARRGNRTIAKEKLYRHINTRVRALYPNFNIGITTGHDGDHANRWHHPYRHWLFLPNDRET